MTAVATAALLALPLATPALAADGGDESTATQQAAPTLRAELVDVPGSLHAVAASLGLAHDGAPTGAGVGIALIDTGVTDVPALRNSRVVIGPDFSFEAANDELRGRDLNGHGTHLAGLIVGSDAAWAAGNRTRLPGRQIGVAPDATLVSVKVGAHNGAVDVSQVIAAINWVIARRDDHDIRVLSLAYGTDSMQDWQIDPLSHAVERAWHAGIVVVVGAGNSGQMTETLSNPSANPWVIGVGAAMPYADGRWLHHEEALVADFSQGGHAGTRVHTVAPGRSIVGPRAVGAFADTVNHAGRIGDDLVLGSGTSQATAVAAGAIAALLEARPELTPDQVKGLLHLTGHQAWADEDESYRRARFPNVRAAVEHARVPRSQKLARSDGSGSLDAARGSHRVTLDGAEVRGELDVLGVDHSATSWTTDSFTDLTWTAGSWDADTWNGFSWNGLSWNGFSWNGYSWNGLSWNGLSWHTDDFNGLSWNGLSWNGFSWNGFSWNGLSWNGSAWD